MKIASIILAAGKGTRMGSPDKQKVCFPVAGTPAILRSMRTYSSLGISPHVVVVGHGAEQVMEMVNAEFSDVSYAFQAEQKGTGNATKVGVNLLKNFNYSGDILVVAGDKIVEPAILLRLIVTFYERKSDLAFIVGECADSPDAGRVILSDTQHPLAVVETFDLIRWELLSELWRMTEKNPVPSDVAEAMARRAFPKEKKMMLAIGSLWPLIERNESVYHHHIQALTGGTFPSLNLCTGCEITAKDNQLANLSVYLFRAHSLYHALDRLTSDNAQQEEYLTDVIGLLSSEGGHRLHIVRVDDPHQVMAFNSQEELRTINGYFQHAVKVRMPSSKMQRPSQWLEALEREEMMNYVQRLYHGNKSISVQKMNRLKQLLIHFRQEYGDVDTIISRAPGRVNLMGRHIDHQGGHCNLIAIDREIFVVAAQREDDVVMVSNWDGIKFPKREFRLGDYRLNGDWLQFLNSEAAKKIERGDWSNYIRAACLRFQSHFRDERLKGMNMAFSGDIPIAAGLSSSSAMVVATAEALVALNRLQIDSNEFVERCGEGEWFVGTRGGCADHAAMKMGKKGQVVHVGFFPFRIDDIVPFPDDHLIVICDSHIKAYKSAESRTIFNQRVACYHLGRLLFKKYFPRLADRIEHLRDISPHRMQLNMPEFYRALQKLPCQLSQEQVKKLLRKEEWEQILSSHSAYEGLYPIRDIVLFGLSECERSRKSPVLLKEGQITEFGRLMNISHDGDRIVKFDDQGNETPYEFDCSSSYFEQIEQLARKNDHRAELYLQAGSYRCSIREIDLIVDLANSIAGVKGAQLSGAGLGGCAMVLVEESAIEDLIRVLADKYYATSDIEPAIAICTPVAGSGVFEYS